MWTVMPLVSPKSEISNIEPENERGWNSEERELTHRVKQGKHTKNNLQNNFLPAFNKHVSRPYARLTVHETNTIPTRNSLIV